MPRQDVTARVARTSPGAAPLQVESREQLVYLLTQACELEHGLMCEYLFAQFTLKQGIDEGVTAAQLERIRVWDAAITDVAVGEMLHLALATNLLTALGAPPHFDRPNFPILSGWYPPGVQIALVPFGERALRHFVYLERPESIDVEDAEGFQALGEAEPLGDPSDLMAVPEDWVTVGHLYRSIEAGLAHLIERDGLEEVFVGSRRDQARWQAFRWAEITPVVDMPSATKAIEHIIEQGEGARGDWRQAHFGIFLGILHELQAMRTADPGFEPARAAVPGYRHELDDADAPVALISDPFTADVADLFDAVYETALMALARYFVHTSETDAQVVVLAQTAQRLMGKVLRPIGICLTTLPLGSDPAGPRAGPGFTMVSPTFYLLPRRNAAWRVLRSRLGELAERAGELAVRGALPDLEPVAAELRGLRERVDEAMPASAG